MDASTAKGNEERRKLLSLVSLLDIAFVLVYMIRDYIYYKPAVWFGITLSAVVLTALFTALALKSRIFFIVREIIRTVCGGIAAYTALNTVNGNPKEMLFFLVFAAFCTAPLLIFIATCITDRIRKKI